MARPKKADEQKQLAPAMQPHPQAAPLAQAQGVPAGGVPVAVVPPPIVNNNDLDGRSIDVPNFIRVRDNVCTSLFPFLPLALLPPPPPTVAPHLASIIWYSVSPLHNQTTPSHQRRAARISGGGNASTIQQYQNCMKPSTGVCSYRAYPAHITSTPPTLWQNSKIISLFVP